MRSRTADGLIFFTNDHGLYEGMPNRHHESVPHRVGTYVRRMANMNGMQNIGAMLKHAHKGTFRKISPKHLHQYIAEIAGRPSIRPLDSIDQMRVLPPP